MLVPSLESGAGMVDANRRMFLAGAGLMATGLAGCNSTAQPGAKVALNVPQGDGPVSNESFQALYGPVSDRFPIAGLKPDTISQAFWRTESDNPSREGPGTIVVDPHRHYLYHVQANGRTMRYGVGVGREGFAWSGTATINSKQEWPDWYPPKEMIERQPDIKKVAVTLQSGIGVPGGLHNPLGARAMYLWQNNKDTLFRIHGTLEPWTIGKNVSSGCIRMVNQDVIHLYERVAVGTKVVVL